MFLFQSADVVRILVVNCTTVKVKNVVSQAQGIPASRYKYQVRRDVTLDKTIGDGRVFGTLGQNDKGLFGKGGFEHQIFNDGRGDLKAQAYGTHVLGPAGDSSHLGGALNWKNPNAAASLDISKQIHGGTSYQAAAGGRWPVGKNGDFSLQGTYGKQWGLPKEYGGLANFNYRW